MSLQVIEEALINSTHPELKNSRLLEIKFHSQSLFPIYRLVVETQSHEKIKLAAKLMHSKQITQKQTSTTLMKIPEYHKEELDNLKTMVSAEEGGLRILQKAKIPTPKSYGYVIFKDKYKGYTVLFMSFIESSRNQLNKQSKIKILMEDLHKLYSNQGEYFGWHQDGFIGILKQENKKCKNFEDFWWSQRLKIQLEITLKQGRLTQKDGIQLHEAVINCIREWDLNTSKPRLIHGDLWSGNLLEGTDAHYYFIDPCLSYSNPEQDLAMLDLFGNLLSIEQEEEIAVKFGIGPNFHSRKPFWQLYPLLVHVNIFGNTYMPSLRKAIQYYL